MFAEVEALLSVEQFCSCHKTDTCMYYDVDSLVISNRFEVDTSDIVSATQPPSGLLTWDHESGTFECVTIEVYSESYIFKSVIILSNLYCSSSSFKGVCCLHQVSSTESPGSWSANCYSTTPSLH